MRAKQIQERMNAAQVEIDNLGKERLLITATVKVIAHANEVKFSGSQEIVGVSVDDLQRIVDFIARMYGIVGTLDGENA